MCCGRRRTPIVVSLGKMAYDKYQSNKAEKQARSLSDPNNAFIQHTILPEEANHEILQKSNIDNPPSYDDVVVNRSIVPQELNLDEKGKPLQAFEENQRDEDDLSDTESFYEVVNGMTHGDEEIIPSESSSVEPSKSKKELKQAWRENKKAAKSEYREEKRAAKLEWREEKRASKLQRQDAWKAAKQARRENCRAWCEQKKAAKLVKQQKVGCCC